MKHLLVSGGFVDVATLHPLWTALVLLGATLALRRALRAFGPVRRGRER